MKNICKKIANVLGYIYGTGIALALFVGALSLVGYIVAFCIGGETATEICRVIYKEIYPILFIFSASVVFVGLIKMYLNGEVAFTIGKKKTDKERKEEPVKDLESEPAVKVEETPEQTEEKTEEMAEQPVAVEDGDKAKEDN